MNPDIRDLQKREVDFVVIRNGEPWFLVEVKHGDAQLTKNLAYFQKQTGASYAFQVSIQADYLDAECLARQDPTIVPARTFFAQLF